MKFIAVYDKDTKDYSGKDRLGFLENAKEIHIRQTKNGVNWICTESRLEIFRYA